jgi:mannose-6-phosphate isomerase-like protein (cupin superfamily)
MATDTPQDADLRLDSRIVRYADLVPCLNAFIDTRTPGSEAKENFTIIGPGVSENPNQHVHIVEPHGFNIGGARQPPGCVNSQHSHDTAETFVVHSGRWRITFGEHGEDASIEAGPGDVVSIPTNTFRGFTNVGDDTGFLWVVLGGDKPGRVLWAPDVFDKAEQYGLILLDNGGLVDTTRGETVAPGAQPMKATSPEQVSSLHRTTMAEAERLAVRCASDEGSRDIAEGVTDTPIIGQACDGLTQGPLGWPHGFSLRRRDMRAAAATRPERRDVSEVWFVHQGRVQIGVDGETAQLGAGDTVTIPSGALRTVASRDGAQLFVVLAGDAPPPSREG